MENETILSVKDLKVFFYTNQRCNKAVGTACPFRSKRGRHWVLSGKAAVAKRDCFLNYAITALLSRIESGEISYYTPKAKLH